MKGVRFLQGGIRVKKILFLILAVLLVVSSGVQIQAAELPFVPDGEETTSEVKEDKKETTEETKNEVTQETKEETTATNNDSTDGSSDSDESTTKSDDIELPVEALGDNTLTAVDDGIVIDNDKHLDIVDKDGNSDSKDVDGNVIEDVQEDITEATAEAATNNTSEKYDSVLIFAVIGAAALLLLLVVAVILVKRKKRG